MPNTNATYRESGEQFCGTMPPPQKEALMARYAPLFSRLALTAALGLLAVLPGTAHSGDVVTGSGVDLCADFTPPGCVHSGCAEGQVCDRTVGCLPSLCECEPTTGNIVCTEDCGGGTCVAAPPTSCCDPAEEPGTGDNPICFEGATCCSDGIWLCNLGDGTPSCNVLGSVCEEDLCADFVQPGCVQSGCAEGQVCDTTVGCVPSLCECDPATGNVVCTDDCSGGTCVPAPTPICCDPANEPGAGDNPICFEGHSCCADGNWSCNAGGGTSTCEQPSEACTACCDPAKEPGTGDNPICFEGASCCATGSWQCNLGDASTSCEVVGIVCEEDLCAGFTPPGCVQSGCAEGQVCDRTVGCVPSQCECDPSTGQVICTDDCGGGTCVPEPTSALLGAGALLTLVLLRRRAGHSSST